VSKTRELTLNNDQISENFWFKIGSCKIR